MIYLAWLGVVPFILSILLNFFDYSLGAYSGAQIFVFYSVIICCFMAGTLWGQAIKDNVNWLKKAFASNLIALTVFFCLIFGGTKTVLLTMVICYLLLVIYECILYRQSDDKTMMSNYIRMRIQVTLTVVVLHIALYLSL
ncbi:hypothetical protein GZ77_06985 [Endozoicomonas montiporae]|uniref:DUF3429 domain-containing protein n=2 Tax=Endozoicomonas montiporae TaxID=1027273 RepID=A0A081N6V7_9GAMM|nr:DUF3429 domain-containing protein [Endozoicomonas montiporae]AMO56520.1 hypothetical protein EZMO1_2429 [Endozoicomonas montiporae CL-33]KEQ14180.1 hypothetical protein GZ77_06985 [Endozoicomonas montiporae]